MTVELVLALLVNLLHTRAPDAPPPALGATAAAHPPLPLPPPGIHRRTV
jgi:hypothetical protein